MKTIYLHSQNLAFWQKHSRENVIALGFFDGVHKGHQKVIRQAKKEAERRGVDLTVMSFFPHPKVVLSGGKKKFNYLMPLKAKAEVLESLGVDRFYIVEFDMNFASLSPQDYVEKYLLKFSTVHAVAGYDFHYGKLGEGSIDRLKEDSAGRLDVTKVNKVEYLGKKISSTRIRRAIVEGQVNDLSVMMGRLYEVKGKILNHSFFPDDYYMLPRSGNYEVTINSGSEVFYTTVQNNPEEGRLEISDERIGQELNGLYISVTWRKRLSDVRLYELVCSRIEA
ncbi:FAD synthetase family protein [Thalassobacillus devorans]|uniref:FAD synthetase family protein n=1 Tax=Thalassobacillus devorans TaxID=279813 RepID=UPI00048BEDE6|nr:FAD synthetase family protein [Thalassobacillus devorans]